MCLVVTSPKLYFLHDQEEEAGNDLSVCMLKRLPEVRTLPSLLTISIVKTEIQIFQITT